MNSIRRSFVAGWAALSASGGDRPTTASSRGSGPLLFALAAMLLVGGCVTAYPEAENVAPLGVEAARNGERTGQLVRWGGTIVDVLNTDSGTRLQVVSRPLRSSGRPVRDNRSEGRFIARVASFLDPEIYRPGRDISLIGHVGATEKGTVGEASYTFATLDVQNYQYWKPEPPVVQLPPGFYNDRLFRQPADWPFDYYRNRPLPRPVIRLQQRNERADSPSAD